MSLWHIHIVIYTKHLQQDKGFFTVYGSCGRPDMAYFSFTNNILADKQIKVFNHGKMEGDFTYIDDIIKGIIKLIDKVQRPIKTGMKVRTI